MFFIAATYEFWRYALSGTTASTSISTNHSGFTNRLIAMIVSTGRASTQYFFLASIVGHAETIPGILEGLGAFNEIKISQTDFANLFILLQSGADEPRLIRMSIP
jgi:hypothetical protein